MQHTAVAQEPGTTRAGAGYDPDMTDAGTRDVAGDGSVVLRDERCAFRYTRPRPGVVHVTITGHDRGQLGSAPLDELRVDIVRYPPIELFVDVSEAVGASVPVQDEWTAWFAANRPALTAVHILAPGKYLHFTAEVMKLFSRTGDLIRVYLDPAAFAERLRATAAAAG